MEHEIEYGRSMIKFSVNRRNRKTLAIHVESTGDVVVDAPMEASIETIREKVKKRGDWITRQQRDVIKYAPPLPPRKYVSGEEFRYLGRQLRLKVKNEATQSVRVIGKHIEVGIQEPSSSTIVQAILEKWERQQATILFEERLDQCLKRVRHLNLKQRPKIKIRAMEKRWGSCTKHGTIILNPKLIEVAIECVDYVITHELCHLAERNHNPKFFELLSISMRDWKQLKERIEGSN